MANHSIIIYTCEHAEFVNASLCPSHWLPISLFLLNLEYV